MDTLYEIRGTSLIIFTPKELDHHVAEMITEHTDLFITGNNINKVIFDFSNTEFMDSSGIGVVMGRYKMIRRLGGRVVLRNLNNTVNRIFSLSGIYKLIGEGNVE